MNYGDVQSRIATSMRKEYMGALRIVAIQRGGDMRSNWQMLANAVVVQACTDIRRYAHQLKKGIISPTDRHRCNDAIDFLVTDRSDLYTEADGVLIVERLADETGLKVNL